MPIVADAAVAVRGDLAPFTKDLEQGERKGEQLGRTLKTAIDKAVTSTQELGRSFQVVDRSADGLVSSFNRLTGRGPKELADQLDRAAKEAAEAVVQVHKLSAAGELSPREAQKYADALNEIGVEADQTIADLRELQRADPNFDEAELNQVATLIDKIGDEATATADELNRMGRADTTLEGISRQSKGMAGNMNQAQLASGGLTQSLGQLAPTAASVAAVDLSDVLEETAEKTNVAAKATEGLTDKMKGGVAAMSAARIAVGAFAASFVGIKIVQFFKDSIDAASDLAETTSKVNVVFDDAAETVLDMGRTSAMALGMSEEAALSAAGTYGNLFRAMGIASDVSADMSVRLVQLAADLASFNNMKPEEVLDKLRAGLSGETEPLKSLGININAVRLENEAMLLGFSKTNGQLDAAAKAQAAYSLILKDTMLAQGDFERTSEGLANQQRILQARLENVSAEFGERLLPVMVDLITFLNDTGIPVLRETLDLLSMEAGSARGIPLLEEVEGFLNNVGGFGSRLNEMLLGRENEMRAAAERLGVPFEDFRRRLHNVMERTGVEYDEALGRISGSTNTFLGEQATILPQGIKAATAGVGEAATEMAQQIPDAMEEAKEEAEAIARQTPGSLANQLRAGIEEYDEAIDELAEVAANSVNDLAERQKIEGILASKELTDALNSDSTRTLLLAMELVNDLVSDYELLAPGALAAGKEVSPQLSNGIRSNLALASAAGDAIVDAAGNPLVDLGPLGFTWGANYSRQFMLGMGSYWQSIRNTAVSLADAAAVPLRFRSPPVMGPLKESDKWGGAFGELIADGMLGSTGGIANASLAMAGAAVPSLTAPSLGMATAAGAVPANGGVTYQLVLNGVPKTFSSEEQMLDALKELSAFGEGRLSGG